MRPLIRGVLAGGLAGLITSLFWFVDYGPGNSLHTVARWFLLDSASTGRQVGFLLLLILGCLFGLLFEIGTQFWRPTLGSYLLLGLLSGALFWLLIPLCFGTLVFHGSLTFGNVLYTSVPLLTYGLVLGSLAFQLRTRRRTAR